MASSTVSGVHSHDMPEYFDNLESTETRTPDIDISSSSEEDGPSPKSHKSRSQMKKQRKSQHQMNSPVRSLRPAKDIISRIRHDAALEESQYVVGYLDRHLPHPVEMDVMLWKGGRDVEEEDWIPQHRILYFRKKGDAEGVHVWNREKRLDRICGSGILEELEAKPVLTVTKAEEEQKGT